MHAAGPHPSRRLEWFTANTLTALMAKYGG
jgi:hypothetical protein